MESWMEDLDQASTTLIYGRDFEGDPVDLLDLIYGEYDYESVIVRGKVINIRSWWEPAQETYIRILIYLLDGTESTFVKMFLECEENGNFLDQIKEGDFLILEGTSVYDFSMGDRIIDSIVGIRKYNNIYPKGYKNKGASNIHENTTWMIRTDGLEIPCNHPVCGSLNCPDETLYAAQWLYEHTCLSTTKQLVILFILSYADSLDPERDPIGNLLEHIQSRPYITVTEDFANKIAFDVADTCWEGNPNILNQQVCERLDQEFIQACLGREYMTEEGGRDLYFQIQRIENDWNSVIQNFVKIHRKQIDSVTARYDKRSTGQERFMLDTHGREIDHLILKNFNTEDNN